MLSGKKWVIGLQNLNTSAEAVIRHSMPFVLAAICIYSAPQVLNTVSLPDVVFLIGTLPLWAWFLAMAFTVVSFYAVGQYDVLARRHLGALTPDGQARRNGMVAVALSQTFGFGLITGSLARYRLRPDEGPLRAGQITGLVTLFFLTGLVVIVALAGLLSGVLIYRGISISVLLGTISILIFLTLWRPNIRFKQREISIPSLTAVSAALFWTAVDVLAAAAVLYILLPAQVQLPFFAFLPVFCLALGAGTLSGVPGGVGPFECVLLALTANGMPAHIDPTLLMTAILGFRIVYFVVPAISAAFVILRPNTSNHSAQSTPKTSPPHHVLRAETGVIAQNGGAMVSFTSGCAALWSTGNSLVVLFDPVLNASTNWVCDLKHYARQRNLLPVIYKCSARTATAARKEKWCAIKVAKDAIITPTTFDTKGSKNARLRRKLRKATSAGTTIETFQSKNLRDLEQIDAIWQSRCGSPRGGTMGRFCPSYIEDQLVLVAKHNGKPVAFITLHTGPQEWALDIMRDCPTAPDGSMYLLVHAAIQMAATAKITKFSLAAVPVIRDAGEGFQSILIGYMCEKFNSKGLAQFKSAFNPKWEPLYMLAPTRLGLCLGAIDLLREIHRPAKVGSAKAHPDAHPKHQRHQTPLLQI